MALLLAERDVRDLLDLRSAMGCLEAAFREQGRGQVVDCPPSVLSGGEARMLVKSGALRARRQMGVRLTSGNRPGQNSSFAVLYESPGGRLVRFMTYPFTELRLQASAALGVDRLARPGAQRVALIGTGRLAPGILRAVCSVRPVERVRALSRQAENRARFVAEGAGTIDVPLTAADTAEEAVDGANIVVVVTTSRTPVLRAAWLDANALVVSIGSRMEIGEDVYRRARLMVTTSVNQELSGPQSSDEWTLVHYLRSGGLCVEDLVEMHEVIAGLVSRGEGIAVYRDPEGGFTDVALASWVYEKAVVLGRGTEWSD